MKNPIIKKLFWLSWLASLVVILFPYVIFAQTKAIPTPVTPSNEGIVTPVKPNNDFRNWCQVNYPNFNCNSVPDLGQYIAYLYRLAVYAAAIIVIFIIVREGFAYFLASGNPAKSNEAKGKIYSAFLGLIILLAGSLILSTISPNLNSLDLNLKPLSYSFKALQGKERTVTTRYLAIPLGEIITEASFSENFMKSIVGTADRAEKLKKNNKEIQALVEEFYNTMQACTCGQSRCLDNVSPCNNAICTNGSCDKEKLAELKSLITEKISTQKDNIATVRSEMKKQGKGFETPKSSLRQLSAVNTLLNLTDGINVIGYYDFLALREDAGKNIIIEYDTNPFLEWKPLFDRKTFDPTVFYINKDEAELAIIQAQHSMKNMNVDPITDAERYSHGASSGTKDPSFDPGDDSDQPLPEPPSDTNKLPKNYPMWYQGDGAWGNCLRGIGGSAPLWKSGCADTSLSMAIGYWYKYNAITRRSWLSYIRSNPPSSSMDTAGGSCLRPEGDAPDPYRVLYYMNYYGGNLADGTWDEEALGNWLEKINLTLQPLYRKSFDAIAHQSNDLGKSVLLFCDHFGLGRSYRASKTRCSWEGDFACNHYVLVTKVEGDKMYINDPGFGEPYLTRGEYSYFSCGEVVNEDMSFAVYPIKWK